MSVSNKSTASIWIAEIRNTYQLDKKLHSNVIQGTTTQLYKNYGVNMF